MNNGTDDMSSAQTQMHNPVTQTDSAALMRAAELGLFTVDGPFVWNEASKVAAMCLAGLLMPPSETSPYKVARAVGRGTTPQDIRRWLSHPEFASTVDKMVVDSTQKLYEQGLTLKANRVMAAQRRHAMLMQVLEAREEWAAMQAPDDVVADPFAIGPEGEAGGAFVIPGLSTGAIRLVRKSVGSGATQMIVLEGEFDTAIFNELRRLEEQIARELGQWRPDSQVSIDVKLYAGIDLSMV